VSLLFTDFSGISRIVTFISSDWALHEINEYLCNEQLTERQSRGVDTVSFSFLPKGEAKSDCMDYWRGQVYIRVQSIWQTRKIWGYAPLENFDFGPFIRCDLVESGTVFAQT